jgi:hypothetical protein
MTYDSVSGMRRGAVLLETTLQRSAAIFDEEPLHITGDTSAVKRCVWEKKIGRTNRRNAAKTSVDRNTGITLTLTVAGCN